MFGLDVLQIIGLCVACLAIGATCMHAHSFAVGRAVAYERQRAEKREERLRAERDSYMKLYQQMTAKMQEMEKLEANAAGYEDGYRTACRDLEADSLSAGVSSTIYSSLRKGGAVSLRILNHQ